MMIARTGRALTVTVAMLCAQHLLAGCGDDDNPVVPPPVASPWSEVALPQGLPESGLVSVGFHGSRGLALGVTMTQTYLLQTTGGAWERVDIPGAPTALLLLDLAFATDGRAVAVGGTPSGPAAYAERPTWTPITISGAAGTLETVVREDAGTFFAAGVGPSSVAAVRGSIDGAWTPQVVPMPGAPQEKAVNDLAADAAGLWACGWDDGADGSPQEPRSVLLRYNGSTWTTVETPCGGCSDHEFHAVAVNAAGAVLLGGAITDFSAGSTDPYVAFLLLYGPGDGMWTEIVLPQAGSLNCVQDILVASNGDVYLACGEGNGALVRFPDVGAAKVEWTQSIHQLTSLAEGPGGVIYAAGTTGSAVNPTALLLRRDVPAQ